MDEQGHWHFSNNELAAEGRHQSPKWALWQRRGLCLANNQPVKTGPGKRTRYLKSKMASPLYGCWSGHINTHLHSVMRDGFLYPCECIATVRATVYLAT